MMPCDLLDSAIPRADCILLGPMRSPGRATVKGAGDPRKWDVRAGVGFDGGSTVCVGKEPAKFEVEFALWLGSQFLEWQVFARLLLDARVMRVALGISHPALSFPPLSISAVIVEDVSQFSQSDDGLWTCTVKFIQWKRALPIFARPMAAVPGGSTPVPTAQTEAQKGFLKALENVGRLAAQSDAQGAL